MKLDLIEGIEKELGRKVTPEELFNTYQGIIRDKKYLGLIMKCMALGNPVGRLEEKIAWEIAEQEVLSQANGSNTNVLGSNIPKEKIELPKIKGPGNRAQRRARRNK